MKARYPHFPGEFGAHLFAYKIWGMDYGGKEALELVALEKQLAEYYLNISVAFKKMSKTTDNYMQDCILSGVYGNLDKTTELRQKIDTLRKQIADNWNNGRMERKGEKGVWEMPLDPK